MGQGELFRVAIFLEADSHIQMAFFGLRAIGAANPIPPGKVEAEVTVGFADKDRMVDAVHVRGNHNQAQQTIQRSRKFDVAVVEHGTGIQHHLKGEHSLCRCTQKNDRRHFYQHRDDDFQRMKAIAAGDVQIKVGMVHPVQAPQKRGMVEQAVLKIDDEIENDDAEQNLQPEGDVEIVENPPPTLFSNVRQGNGKDGKQQPDCCGVDKNQGYIGKPASSFAVLQRPAGCDYFSESDKQEDSCKNEKSYGLFTLHMDAELNVAIHVSPVNAALAAFLEQQSDFAD